MLFNPSSALLSTTRTTKVVCLATALVESSVAFTNARRILTYCPSNVDIRSSPVSGNTINTATFRLIPAGYEDEDYDINYTGSFYYSAPVIPSSIIASCTTTSGSGTVTAGSGTFSGLYSAIGSLVTGTGIPLGSYLSSVNSTGSIITLNTQADGQGSSSLATASGTVSLTFSGAIIRVTSWA